MAINNKVASKTFGCRINVETAIQDGEQKLPVHPGRISRVPPVRKVIGFNMARSMFHYGKDDSCVVFSERQLQYLDVCGRLFIIHATPGTLQSAVTIIVDVNRKVNP